MANISRTVQSLGGFLMVYLLVFSWGIFDELVNGCN